MKITPTMFTRVALLSSLSLFMVGCGSSSSNDTSGTTLGSITIAIAASDDFAVPSVSGDATGTGGIILNQDTGALSGTITASNLAGTITAGHIHSGLAGTSGGIIVTLEADANDANTLNVPSGTVLSADQMADLLAANYYFNIHTSAVGSGEIRAQITPANYQVIRSSLESQNTVPTPVVSSNNGISYVTINTTSGLLRGNVTNSGLDDATALHIHNGFAGTNGGIVVGLTQDAGNVSFWSIPDNTTLTAEQLTQLLAGGSYFNVHTPANPTGEARAQVIPEGIQLSRVALSGDNEVPTAVVSAGSGVGYATVNTRSGAVVANVLLTGIADASAGHIHSGFAGTNGGVKITLEQDASDSSLFAAPANSVLDSATLADFLAGKLYFNIHSSTNAAGDVRGQLEANGITVSRSVLDGTQQIPAVVTAATGVGYTTVNDMDGSIVANARTNGLTATAAHIHQAATGATGGIVLSLVQDAGDTGLWSASGTLTADQATAFKADSLYFNVHSAANAAGEIRAQIIR